MSSNGRVCEKTLRVGSTLLWAFFFVGTTTSGSSAQTVDWDPLSIDFGTVSIGVAKTETLTLSNTHETEPLMIDSVEFTFNDRGAFSAQAPVPATLGPGESLDVEFTFKPTDFSFHFGDVLIANDSTNAPSLFYQLLGEGRFGTTMTTSTTSTTTTTGTTTSTTLPAATCGDPIVDGNAGKNALVTATDALFMLNVSVGLMVCDPCLCDVNDSGSVTATDALVTLNVAVGLPVSLMCPPCT